MTWCYLGVIARDGRRECSADIYRSQVAEEIATWFNRFRQDRGQHVSVPENGIEWWMSQASTAEFYTVAIRPDGSRHVDPVPVSKGLADALVIRLDADCPHEGRHFAVPVACIDDWKAGKWTA